MRTVSQSRALAVPVLTGGVVAVFGSGIQPLVAGLASDVYRVDAVGYGWLVSAMGISSAIAGLLLAAINERARRSTLVYLGFLVYGAGAVLAGVTTSYPVALGAFLLLGIGHSFVYVCCATALQLRLSEEVRGRVTALHMTAIFVGMPVGAQVGGLLGDLLGLPTVLVAYGTILAAYALTSGITLRGFADLDDDGREA